MPATKQRGNSGGGYDEDFTDSDSDDSSSLTNYSSSSSSSSSDNDDGDGDGDLDRDRAPRAPTPSSDDGWGGRRSSITERSIIGVVVDGGEDGAVTVNPYLRDQAVNLIALGNLYKTISMVRERASGCGSERGGLLPSSPLLSRPVLHLCNDVRLSRCLLILLRMVQSLNHSPSPPSPLRTRTLRLPLLVRGIRFAHCARVLRGCQAPSPACRRP